MKKQNALGLLTAPFFVFEHVFLSSDLIHYANVTYHIHFYEIHRQVLQSSCTSFSLLLFLSKQESQKKGSALVILMGSLFLSPRLLQQLFLCSWPGREIICIMLPLQHWINARHQEICYEGPFPRSGTGVSQASV